MQPRRGRSGEAFAPCVSAPHPRSYLWKSGSGSDPVSSAAIAASVALALAAGWALGSCVLRSRPALERLGAGLLALYGVAGLAMLQAPLHISFLAHTWLVLAVSVAGLAAALAWRWPSIRSAGLRALPLAGGAALVALM